MDSQWIRSLRASLAQVFSTMFFMVPESDPELGQKLGGAKALGWFEGSIRFQRQQEQVTVTIWVPEDLARELAANILATEVYDLDEEQILDAFKEMINMVSGGMLTEVDPEGGWRMGLPQAQVLQMGVLKEASQGCQETLAFEVEGRPLLAGLR